MQQYKHTFRRLKETKVLQNYSYMSALNILSALIGVLLYPYLIRVMGAEQMGTYAFLLGIVMYFQAIVEFGFDMPSAKAVSLNHNKPNELNRILSVAYVCKLIMLLVAALAATITVALIPMLRVQAGLFAMLFLQAAYTVLWPQWYYQGMKNMRFASIVQFILRFSQVPLVLWLVRGPEDLMAYALIVGGTMTAGGLAGTLNLLREGRRPVRVTIADIRSLFRDAFPFFLTSISATVKERTLTTLLGVFLGMREVAIYDLATKIVAIPRLLINSINNALFPEVVGNATDSRVRKILHYERLIGLAAIAGVAIMSYPLVWLLGGPEMMAAIPVTIILSFTVYAFLVAGAYLQFVYIAQGQYRVVAYNQLIAMLSCILICAVGLHFLPAAWMAAVALSASGLIEILYCRWRTIRLQGYA